MEFTLRIELGNDAMRTPTDVAGALMEVMAQVRRHESYDAEGQPEDAEADDGIVRDLNGNTVGRWAFAEPSGCHLDREEIGLAIDCVAMQVQDQQPNPYRRLLHKLQDHYAGGA